MTKPETPMEARRLLDERAREILQEQPDLEYWAAFSTAMDQLPEVAEVYLPGCRTWR